jgi:arginine decarboxylase
MAGIFCTIISMKKKKRNLRKFWKLGVAEWNTEHFDYDKNGNLFVSEGNYNYNLDDLIKKYGSPLEIVFPSMIRERVKDIIDLFSAYTKITNYKGKFFYHYPMKVNQNKEVILPLLSAGAHIEVGSYNELWLVSRFWEKDKANPRLRVLCNGPKTDAYIGLIADLAKKGLLITPIIEDEHELEKMSSYKGDVGIRVDLDIKADTRWDKKVDRFGLLEKRILSLPKMKNFKLLHYHIGSQINSQKSIIQTAKKAFQIYAELAKTHPNLDTIDMGGGFGIPYEKKKFYTTKTVIKQIVKTFKKLAATYGVKEPNIVVEWGRYVVAPSQVTIYEIIAEKPIPKGSAKSWYVIDGSFMNDLLDTWAIHQKWHVVPVNNADETLKSVWLAGSSCDSDDKYTGGNYILAPKLRDNQRQYLCFLDSGAYQDALASHHCLLSSPAKLIAESGTIKIARKRETPDMVGRFFGWDNSTT